VEFGAPEGAWSEIGRHQEPELYLRAWLQGGTARSISCNSVHLQSVVPKWCYNGAMVSLSIKDVPDDLAEALRMRARRNHRSIQGELMDILESAVRPRPFRAAALWREVQALGFNTPADAAEMVRESRDERSRD
jgi:plasmid stability protein